MPSTSGAGKPTRFLAARENFKKIQQNSFVRATTVLVGGTAFAQTILVLALPLLTRLYTPDDFSALAVYISLLGIISTAACLRFDIAIPMPERDEDAANLLALALLFGVGTSATAGVLVFFYHEEFAGFVGNLKIAPYLWLVPLGVFFASSYSSLQFWAVRKKAFRSVAMTRMTQAVGGVGTQAALGWAGISPLGLLLGHLVSSGAGIFGLARRMIKVDRAAITGINPQEMRRLFKKYDRYPRYSTFEALANTAGVQLPIILIAAAAIGPEAGFLMLAMRVMQAPMALVGTAVGQVYLSRAGDEHRVGNLGGFTADILGGLVKTGVGPLLFCGIIAPQVFPLVFGEEWGRAGVLVSWMTPWFVVQFLASTVAMSLHVTNNQRSAMILQALGFVFRVGGVLFSGVYLSSSVSEVYAVSGFLFYSLYLTVIGRVAGLKVKLLLRRIASETQILLVWASLALIIVLLIEFFS